MVNLYSATYNSSEDNDCAVIVGDLCIGYTFKIYKISVKFVRKDNLITNDSCFLCHISSVLPIRIGKQNRFFKLLLSIPKPCNYVRVYTVTRISFGATKASHVGPSRISFRATKTFHLGPPKHQQSVGKGQWSPGLSIEPRMGSNTIIHIRTRFI